MNAVDKIIKSEELIELSKEYGEILIDSNLQDSPLKEIPILSTLISLYKFSNSISESIFRKKLFKFLYQIHDIDIRKREELIDKINNSAKYENSVGETVIEIVEKVDSEKKPNIIGKLFRAFLEEKISYDNFLSHTHVIAICNVQDLVRLKNGLDGDLVNSGSDFLMILGLFSTDFVKTYEAAGTENGNQNFTILTPFGEELVKYGLNGL